MSFSNTTWYKIGGTVPSEMKTTLSSADGWTFWYGLLGCVCFPPLFWCRFYIWGQMKQTHRSMYSRTQKIQIALKNSGKKSHHCQTELEPIRLHACHHMNGELQFKPVKCTIDISYTIPVVDPITWYFSAPWKAQASSEWSRPVGLALFTMGENSVCCLSIRIWHSQKLICGGYRSFTRPAPRVFCKANCRTQKDFPLTDIGLSFLICRLA